ncbi:hypothetical protein C7B61_07750 [filamentous cyanobacterium CCP1]|nr:hypothetical protein C7B76_21485 [filamentous cyanobacterium CCP2]PSB67133.1 hypothetical protein C7B61_07750 [filamentous cyanobacterium CCP1]
MKRKWYSLGQSIPIWNQAECCTRKMKFKTLRTSYLWGKWLGIASIHWLFALGWLLINDPPSRWTIDEVVLISLSALSSLILCFWTIYLLGGYFRPVARYVIRFRLPLFQAIYALGRAITGLVVLMGAAKLLPGVLPDGEFFRSSDREFFWVITLLAIAQGLQYFFYKFTSGSPSRHKGLSDQIEKGQPIDWRYPMGGEIGVELRRLRRLAQRSRRHRPRSI